MTCSLLEAFRGYGTYVQQKGKPMAEAFLAKMEVDPATATAIKAMFNDQGKLIDPASKKPLGLGDLMGMRNLI